MDLPIWFYSSNDELPTYASILYCMKETCNRDQELIFTHLQQQTSTEVSSWDDILTIHKITPYFYMLLCYESTEIKRVLKEYIHEDPNLVVEYDNETDTLEEVVDLLGITQTQNNAFESIDQLISVLSDQSLDKFSTNFIRLMEEFVRRSESTIKFFYQAPIGRILQLCNIYEPLRLTLHQTIEISEPIAIRYLGNITGPERFEVPNYIDDLDYLLDFIEDSGNEPQDRLIVLQSIIYRQVLSWSESLDLIQSHFAQIIHQIDDYKQRTQDLFTFILKERLNESTPKFVSTYDVLANFEVLTDANIAEILLETGKVSDFMEYLDQGNPEQKMKFSSIKEKVEQIMEPPESDEEEDLPTSFKKE